MVQSLALFSLAFSLGGCVTPADTPANAVGATIDYSLSPCFGFCPSFDLSVTPDGAGTYDGKGWVATRGEARFTASDWQYRAFAERLAPFRPESSVTYGYDNCDGPLATDSPSVEITWREPGEEPVTLNWYMGCRQPGLAENSQAISSAWQELPVGDLVGSDEERQKYGGFE